MEQSIDKLNKIYAELRELIAEHKALKMAFQELQQENEVLKKEHEKQKIEINAAQDRNKFVKLANSTESNSEDSKALKKEIETYISKIEKCLTWLDA